MNRLIHVERKLGLKSPHGGRFAQKSHGGGLIALLTQEKIDGPPLPIHGPIQIGLLPFEFQ